MLGPNKRKKRLIILIIIITRILDDLDQMPPVTGTIFEALEEQITRASNLFLFDTDEENWGSAEEDAWRALEDIHDELQGDKNVNVLTGLSADLQYKLELL